MSQVEAGLKALLPINWWSYKGILSAVSKD